MDINQKVAERIAGSNEKIQESVVEHLAGKEIERRTNAVIKVFSELAALEKEVSKIKPDLSQYDSNGDLVVENWSKSKLDERNKKIDKRNKLTAALDKALDKNDFSDLLNVEKQVPQNNENSSD